MDTNETACLLLKLFASKRSPQTTTTPQPLALTASTTAAAAATSGHRRSQSTSILPSPPPPPLKDQDGDIKMQDVKPIRKSHSAPNSPQRVAPTASISERETKIGQLEEFAFQEFWRFLHTAHHSLRQSVERARFAKEFLTEVFGLGQTATDDATDVDQLIQIINQEATRVAQEDHTKMLNTSKSKPKTLSWKLGVLYAQGFNRWIRQRTNEEMFARVVSPLPQLASQLFAMDEIHRLELPRMLRL